ncbi:hypothetical protein IQ264_06150 [Phormidium sp. LEGE 05292]|uniref:hypothetical protein n=1 Tax=[Phormidium] sp. LEGE 05292 TaxID=767427 RepID=UPI00188143FB|nr:hypothetical protein [Phormidium sp. LEGE 05292]MBE9225016.1 hypothetical protein [Phormidium sp. LEGE 05292]
MHHLFSNLQKSLHKVLVSTLIVLLSLSVFVLFPAQNSLAAAPSLRQPIQTQKDNSNQSETAREKAYDQEINALNNPQGLEKEYKENLEAYEETQPDKGIIQEAKSLVEKATGKQ